MEASLLIPFILFLFALLFYLTFFLYNRCIVSQDAYIIAFRGSIRCQESKTEILHYMEENSKKQFGTKYIGIKAIHKKIDVDGKNSKVQLTGAGDASFAAEYGIAKRWQIGSVWEARRLCPTQEIRKMRLILKQKE